MNDLTAILESHERALAARPTVSHLDYILIDGSASMQDKWWNFLTAVDVLLDDMRAANVPTHILAHVFDSTAIYQVARDMPLAECPGMIAAPFGANFSYTPLYDAINVMGQRLQELNPKSASILIVTDGDDNHSSTSVIQARAVLDWIRANGWQVNFIGCDFNNSKQAAALGMTDANAIGVAKQHLTDAAKNLAAKRIRHAQSGADISFNENERQQFGGYLTKN